MDEPRAIPQKSWTGRLTVQKNIRTPRIYLHSTQSMQQHYSSKPIEQNSKSRLAQPQDGFDDNGEAVLAYFLEAFTASTAFCSD
ncbi:hypothetical protein [Bifidobacterium longum]|uniref:hypothetical protein n=1 Tax=Bifidobacterium longum TaxID=216816 RepID=UPI0032194422